MDLKEQFTKETGCGTSNWKGDGYYPPYTEWLEEKLKSNPPDPIVRQGDPQLVKKSEKILLSDLAKHLRFDFEDDEVIKYKIKFKQGKGKRELKYH